MTRGNARRLQKLTVRPMPFRPMHSLFHPFPFATAIHLLSPSFFLLCFTCISPTAVTPSLLSPTPSAHSLPVNFACHPCALVVAPLKSAAFYMPYTLPHECPKYELDSWPCHYKPLLPTLLFRLPALTAKQAKPDTLPIQRAQWLSLALRIVADQTIASWAFKLEDLAIAYPAANGLLECHCPASLSTPCC